MIEILQKLITALREELQQYGEMLALLDQQQELIVARAADDLLQVVSAIQNQALIILNARQSRAQCQRELAQKLSLPADAEFAALDPLLPPEYQPLLQALIQENNQLLARIQQRGRQNHLLLSRSLELMQRFLSTLFPGRDTVVYNERGSAFLPKLATNSIYDAVG